MHLLTRHVAAAFLRPLGYSLVLCDLIQLVSHLFDDMSSLQSHHARAMDVAAHYGWSLPLWTAQFLPVAILIATLLSLGALSRHHELTAMRAGGVSLMRITAPIFALGAAAAATSFLLHELVIPEANRRARLTWEVRISKQGGHQPVRRERLVLRSLRGGTYTAQAYDIPSATLEEVKLDRFDARQTLTGQLYGRRARWIGSGAGDEGGYWIFTEGIERWFPPTGAVGRQRAVPQAFRERAFSHRVVWLPEGPSDFAQEYQRPDELRMRPLLKYIARIRNAGGTAAAERVELHLKFALPAANLLVVLLGVSFAVWSPRSERMLAVAISLLISFLYWGLVQVGHAAGAGGRVPPMLAAWSPNLLFGGFGSLLFWKVRK